MVKGLRNLQLESCEREENGIFLIAQLSLKTCPNSLHYTGDRKQRDRESFQLLYLKTCPTTLLPTIGPNWSYHPHPYA